MQMENNQLHTPVREFLFSDSPSTDCDSPSPMFDFMNQEHQFTFESNNNAILHPISDQDWELFRVSIENSQVLTEERHKMSAKKFKKIPRLLKKKLAIKKLRKHKDKNIKDSQAIKKLHIISGKSGEREAQMT